MYPHTRAKNVSFVYAQNFPNLTYILNLGLLKIGWPHILVSPEESWFTTLNTE